MRLQGGHFSPAVAKDQGLQSAGIGREEAAGHQETADALRAVLNDQSVDAAFKVARLPEAQRKRYASSQTRLIFPIVQMSQLAPQAITRCHSRAACDEAPRRLVRARVRVDSGAFGDSQYCKKRPSQEYPAKAPC